MPDSLLNLTDLAKVNDNNNAERQISDLLDEAPVLARLAADVASNGTTHKYVKETGAPTVGFRDVNAGRDLSKSADTQVTVNCKILDATSQVDVAVASGYSKGADSYLAREAARHLRAAYFKAEQQFINGIVGADAAGFQGLADVLTHSYATVHDATGSTANTGSSVYGIRTTSDLNNVVAIAGNDGRIDIGDTVTVKAIDADNKSYPAFYTPIIAWLALQIGSAASVSRICNLTAQPNKTLTDDIIANMLALLPSNKLPTFLAMGRRSLFQLRDSRTATNATGAPAPIPTDAFGIPIVVTEAITATEGIISGT